MATQSAGAWGANATRTCKVLKGGKALFTGGDYEKNLLQSLDMIKEKSTSLMEEALKSHIHAVHMCTHAPSTSVLPTRLAYRPYYSCVNSPIKVSQETRNLQKQVLEKQQELADGLLNSFNHLLVDHVRLRDRQSYPSQLLTAFSNLERLCPQSSMPLSRKWSTSELETGYWSKAG